MNQLSPKRRVQVVKVLVDGCSINATVRMTGVAKNTVLKLLAGLGEACLTYQESVMVNLPCKRLQVDEVWAFCRVKEKHVPDEFKGTFGYGDVWTWAVIDAETKLVPVWYVGNRSGEAARLLIDNLAPRLANRVQLTSDGHKAYLEAVEDAFGGEIDYAMLIKLYGGAETKEDQRRYSPAECTGTEKRVITGNPDAAHISTSYIERQNLTMRMSMRRFTRLTNAFSKKVENHIHAVALHFVYYNFARPHASLKNPYPRTPAMAAGITDHVWSVDEIVGLLSK